MSDSVVFVGWSTARAGREKVANEIFSNFTGYLGKQQQTGNVESFEPVLLSPHGGDLAGFILVRGNAEKLSKMVATDEWLTLSTEANLAVDGFGYVNGWTGNGVPRVMGIWQNSIKKY